jgi:hypothetical protein
MLTLSQVRGWDITHLHEAATHWEAVAAVWETSFDAVHQESFAPGGTEWTGEGADAAQYQTAVNRKHARRWADTLLSTAQIARSGADDIQAGKAGVLTAVSRAHDDGFVVGEDFSLFDTDTYTPGEAAIRQTQAGQHSAMITDRVHTLLATDRQVASQMNGRIFTADFPLDTPKPMDPPPPTPSAPGDPITDLMVPPARSAPPPPPFPGEPVIDDVVKKLADRPPTDPLILEALRQAYEANHQPCNGWQWSGAWLGLGGSTAGLIASIPELIPPITPIGVAGGTASIAGIGGSGAALIDCATR